MRWSGRVRIGAVAGALAVLAIVALLLLTRIEGGAGAERVRALGRALNGPGQNDYVAATAVVRRFQDDPGEGDAEAASLLLQSLADPHPATRPPGTVEDALAQMERAAVRSPKRDAVTIEVTMRNGVSDPASGRVLFGPQPAVADCWARVRAGNADPQACIALRKARRIPG